MNILRMTELDSREDSENLDFPPLEGFKEAFTGPHYSDAETERIRNEYDQGKFQFRVFQGHLRIAKFETFESLPVMVEISSNSNKNSWNDSHNVS